MTTPGYDPAQLQDATAIGSDGDKIGTVGQVYLNNDTGQAEWVTIATGLFGMKQSFAPLYGSRLNDGTLTLAVTKEVVKGAPNIDTDGPTDYDEQQTLYDYYSGYLGQTGGQTGYATTGGTDYDTTGAAGYDTTRDRTDYDTTADTTAGAVGADETITRSEEQVRVGTQPVEAGRVRIRKYIVTENVTQTVPVSREEVRVERVPITEENKGDALSGPDLAESEHEVTLHAEQPVVEKETVPVEQIRVGTETVTDQQRVEEQVRKEQIEVDDAAATGARDDVASGYRDDTRR